MSMSQNLIYIYIYTPSECFHSKKKKKLFFIYILIFTNQLLWWVVDYLCCHALLWLWINWTGPERQTYWLQVSSTVHQLWRRTWTNTQSSLRKVEEPNQSLLSMMISTGYDYNHQFLLLKSPLSAVVTTCYHQVLNQPVLVGSKRFGWICNLLSHHFAVGTFAAQLSDTLDS